MYFQRESLLPKMMQSLPPNLMQLQCFQEATSSTATMISEVGQSKLHLAHMHSFSFREKASSQLTTTLA